jgi:hypothetical protein
MRRYLLSYQCVAGCLLVISSITFGRIAVAEASFEHIMQGAKPIGEFRLCESSHTGQSETYSCKDYLSERGRLRLVYQRGPAPQAIYHERRSDVSTGPTLIWVNNVGETFLYYDQERPSRVPSTAIYRGTGVCQDDEDQSAPCSIFEQIVDEDAAIPEIQRYLVFYNPMGTGPSRISVTTQRSDQIMLGIAKHKRLEAFLYELVSRLGEALLNTEGYRERGEVYLKYAHKLRPDSAIHGETRLEAGPELFPKADLKK